MTNKITKDINIIELLEKYPQVAETLVEKGFHCLGCALASFETLEQGADAHGIDVEDLVKELNQVIAKQAD